MAFRLSWSLAAAFDPAASIKKAAAAVTIGVAKLVYCVAGLSPGMPPGATISGLVRPAPS